MILAHHGADNGFTTKNFLRHLEPSLAICSADYDNQYDHPRQEIRDLLVEEGIPLMTTKTGDVIVQAHRRSHRAVYRHQPERGSTGISSHRSFVARESSVF